MTVKITGFADEIAPELTAQIAGLKGLGMSYVEMRGVDGENLIYHTDEKVAQIKKTLDDNGIRLSALGSPLGKILITDDFTPHFEEFKRAVEISHKMECPTIRMFSFYLPADEDPTVYRDEVMERLGRMAETAKGSGIRLCHENEKGIYGDVASRCADILEQIPELGGIFDPANFIQCGQDTLQAWELLRKRIVYFHVKDCVEGGKVVPCGKGIGHVPEILHQFIAQGGWQLTLEPHLTVFSGFADLEKEDAKTKMAAYEYPSQRAAFDAAVAALKEAL